MAEIVRLSDRDQRLLSLAWTEQDDQWHRKNTLQTFRINGHVFGFPYRVLANRQQILSACEMAMRRFARGPARVHPEGAILLHLFVRQLERDPASHALSSHDNSRAHFQYDGYGDLLAVDFGEHGHCAIDLDNRTAVAFMSWALAANTEEEVASALLKVHYCGVIQVERTVADGGVRSSFDALQEAFDRAAAN